MWIRWRFVPRDDEGESVMSESGEWALKDPEGPLIREMRGVLWVKKWRLI